MQIEDPRWRSYARLQRSLRQHTRMNDATEAIERTLDALLVAVPREDETHDLMTDRVRQSAERLSRRRRSLRIAHDAMARDDARVRSVRAPEAAAHARLHLQAILAGANAIERSVVLDFVLGETRTGIGAAAARKRLQRLRTKLGTSGLAGTGTTKGGEGCRLCISEDRTSRR